MNAMAPHVGNATRVFGILLAVETGQTVDSLANVLAVDGALLADTLEKARNGELDRVPAYLGDALPLGRVTSPGAVPGYRAEVLVKRWQRRIARRLAERGQIALAEVHNLLGEAGDDPSNAMARMKVALRDLRIRLTVTSPAARAPLWSLDDESRQRLSSLIASDWRVEFSN